MRSSRQWIGKLADKWHEIPTVTFRFQTPIEY
jgi:hypothetical protein